MLSWQNQLIYMNHYHTLSHHCHLVLHILIPVYINLTKLAFEMKLRNHQTQYLPLFGRLQNLWWNSSNAFFKTKINYMEWLIDFFKYITLPANVNADSLDNIMDINIPITVKERPCRQKSTMPGPNIHVLDLHHKMPHMDV